MNPEPGAARLRAVLDTNVFIAAFRSPVSRNSVLWRAARDGRYQLLTSPAIIKETAGVLRLDSRWTDQRVENIIRRLAQVAGTGLIAPRTVLQVASDPDDDRILECAIHGAADIIVSNDHHLLDLETYADIPIVTSVEFRRILGLK